MWRKLMGFLGRDRSSHEAGSQFRPAEPEMTVCAVASVSEEVSVSTCVEVGPPPAETLTEETAPWWQPRGNAVTAPPPAASLLRPVDTELYRELSRAMDTPEIELPQLPIVAREVLALLRDDNVNFQQAAALAERDPVLTAEILRCVNSVMYRAVRPIERLNTAFARLGVRRLRAMLVGATMRSLAIRSGEGQGMGSQLWRAASASAIINSETARKLGEKEDEAYLAGLLHDIGNLMLLRVLHDYQRKTSRKITRSLFDALAQRWHEHLGLRLADAWHLPDPLPELIGNHHRLPAEDDPLARQRLMLGFTDAVCAMLEFETYIPYDLFNLPVTRRLGLTESPETLAFLAALPATIQQRLS